MNIIVAASGGVAALKTPGLIRRLQEAGHSVTAAASDDAYHFITELSLAVASGQEVFDRQAWFRPDGRARHIDLARWADLLLVAPASADVLASAASARADDVISALILAGVPKVAWLPAMNHEMWHHPLVQRNIAILKEQGHAFLGPAYGQLAAKGEGQGEGRMLEPEDAVRLLPYAFLPQDLLGKRVLVSAGPTREYLDPVRFLSNPSSGKMGFAVAEAASNRGAKVTLVSGPSREATPLGVERVDVESAVNMLTALSTHYDDCDALVMTAAVADWQAADIKQEKQAKMGREQLLSLKRTPDILLTLAERKRHQVVVGFAMETHQGVARAAEKAAKKNMDFICLNYPTQEGTAFGGDDNQITLVQVDGRAERLERLPKRALADILLDRVLALMP